MLRPSYRCGSSPVACSFWGRKNVFAQPGPEGDISYRPRNDSSILPRMPRSCWNIRWSVELRRRLLALALLEALECGSLVRRWKQTIEVTSTHHRLSRGTTPHEREHPRRKDRC